MQGEFGFTRKDIEEARQEDASLLAQAGSTQKESSASSSVLALHVLGSGSKGNCTLIENTLTGETVMVDCGLCKRDVFQRAEEASVDLSKLRGIVITHEHTDHTKGLGVVTRGLAKQGISVPFFVASPVMNASKALQEVASVSDVSFFKAEDQISLAGMQVYPFATSHDAAASFGFRFWSEDDAIGYLTDSGIVTGAAHEALSGVRILALESNHDERMLDQGPYPYSVKKRIASDVGHLSNTQAETELASLLGTDLEWVVAMHISENNNTYRIPVESLRRTVLNARHSASVVCAYQARMVSVR